MENFILKNTWSIYLVWPDVLLLLCHVLNPLDPPCTCNNLHSLLGQGKSNGSTNPRARPSHQGHLSGPAIHSWRAILGGNVGQYEVCWVDQSFYFFPLISACSTMQVSCEKTCCIPTCVAWKILHLALQLIVNQSSAQCRCLQKEKQTGVTTTARHIISMLDKKCKKILPREDNASL